MSPPKNKIGLVTYSIMIAGKEIPASYQVVSIQVSKALNKIAFAKVKLLDGGVAEANQFNLSDSADFIPGKEIEIKVGYHSKTKVLFKGIIIKHGLKITKSGDSYLNIECKDKAIKMTVGRKNAIFQNKADSDIIGEIVNTYRLSKNVEATSAKHKEVVQHYCSDWDFLMMRAEINGLTVLTDDGKLIVKKPAIGGEPVIKITYGIDMLDFQADMDARNQVSKVTAVAWDASTRKIIQTTAKKPKELTQGKTTSATLAKVMDLKEYLLQTSINTAETGMLEAWASAKHAKSYLSKIEGTVTCLGHSAIKPGDTFELAGLSKQFNGKAFAGSVTHIIEEGDWTTQINIGLSFDWYSEEMPQISSPSASGLISPARGLFTGLVKKIHEDPNGEYRVQVSLPLLQKDNLGVWARLASFYAGTEVGAFFYPEVGDEVIVGFLNEDPQCPIILGAVHSKKGKPPFTPDKDNSTKAIVTKSKLKVLFNDKDKIITIETPAGNSIALDDKEGKITLTDKSKNKVEMSKDGILIDCAKDFTVKAKGKIILEATANLEAKAKGSLKAEGMNVELKAKMKMAAEGSATAEFKSGGQTVVKGAIVMIN